MTYPVNSNGSRIDDKARTTKDIKNEFVIIKIFEPENVTLTLLNRN